MYNLPSGNGSDNIGIDLTNKPDSIRRALLRCAADGIVINPSSLHLGSGRRERPSLTYRGTNRRLHYSYGGDVDDLEELAQRIKEHFETEGISVRLRHRGESGIDIVDY